MIRTKNILTNICNSQDVGHQLTHEELKKLQAHLIKMYRDIESVCKRHNLGVCLAYGNVLGAVRHKGWIPWDDDLDVHMSREDYVKFLSEYAAELPSHYKVSSYLNEDGSIARFAKIIDTSTVFVPVGSEKNEYSGVFVDIFPVDYVGRNAFVNSVKKSWAYFMMYTATSVAQAKNGSKQYKDIMFATQAGKANWIFRQIWGYMFSFAKPVTWHRWIEQFAVNRKRTGYVHVLADLDLSFKVVPEEVFYPFATISVPEFGEIQVPHLYKDYLTQIYGDWSVVPDDMDKWHHYVTEINIPD